MTIYKGWNAVIKIDYGSGDEQETNITSFTIEVNRDTTAYYGVGSSTPVALVKSVYDISGSFDTVYPHDDTTPNKLMDLLDDSSSNLTIKIELPSGTTRITLTGVEIKSTSVDITPDDFVKQSVDWIAKGISFS